MSTHSFGITVNTQVRQTTHIEATSFIVVAAAGNHVKRLWFVALCYTCGVVVPVCTIVVGVHQSLSNAVCDSWNSSTDKNTRRYGCRAYNQPRPQLHAGIHRWHLGTPRPAGSRQNILSSLPGAADPPKRSPPDRPTPGEPAPLASGFQTEIDRRSLQLCTLRTTFLCCSTCPAPQRLRHPQGSVA